MAGWSNAIADLDNDGRKDLVVARSNVLDNVALFSPRTYEEPNAVFRNVGNGKFQDVSAAAGAAFQKAAVHRGMAYGDLDNDGRLDVVFSAINSPARVFRNTSAVRNHWILIQLTGGKSNRMAIGAKIRITTADGAMQYNHVTTSTGYASSSDVRVHFGLGAAESIREMEIVWPSGVKQLLRNVKADQVLKVTEAR